MLIPPAPAPSSSDHTNLTTSIAVYYDRVEIANPGDIPPLNVTATRRSGG